MKMRKRDKRSRLRGRRRCGYGFGKKHRGKGSKGGKGMAGTGKKAGQKKTWVNAKMPDYFGRHGFTSRARRMPSINLDEISRSIEKFAREGKAKKTPEGTEIELSGFKVLGRGELKDKVIIKAKSFSASAKEKIEKAGGSAKQNGA